MELCGRCQHMNDHVGKPCTHNDGKPCPCPSGVRSDVFLNEQVGALASGIHLLLSATLVAHNLEIRNGKVISKSGLVDATGSSV